jgi:FkbH-like protein
MEGLDARGILQSVASKNDPDEALAVLEEVGLLDYVLSPQVGWGTKSAAVRAIAEDLGIGIDSLLFIDDQPFERAEVAAAHPSIRVADAAEIGDLLAREELDVPVTPESRRRRHMYRDESRRRAVLAEAPADFDAFLRSCDVRLRLTEPHPDDAERIYELAQRTNQLNYSGDRLDRHEVDEIVAGGGPSTGIVLHVTDRFGDYGTVGFVTLERQSSTITNFFMSCRVQRKKVENAFFETLLGTARRLGVDEVLIRHRATARNAPAVEVLQALGAVPVDWAGGGEDATGEVMYALRSADPIGDADIVTVTDDALHRWS